MSYMKNLFHDKVIEGELLHNGHNRRWTPAELQSYIESLQVEHEQKQGLQPVAHASPYMTFTADML